MKRLLIIATISLCAACGSTSGGDSAVSATFGEKHVTLRDGRTVLCIFADAGSTTAMSCDWAGAR